MGVRVRMRTEKMIPQVREAVANNVGVCEKLAEVDQTSQSTPPGKGYSAGDGKYRHPERRVEARSNTTAWLQRVAQSQ